MKKHGGCIERRLWFGSQSCFLCGLRFLASTAFTFSDAPFVDYRNSDGTTRLLQTSETIRLRRVFLVLQSTQCCVCVGDSRDVFLWLSSRVALTANENAGVADRPSSTCFIHAARNGVGWGASCLTVGMSAGTAVVEGVTHAVSTLETICTWASPLIDHLMRDIVHDRIVDATNYDVRCLVDGHLSISSSKHLSPVGCREAGRRNDDAYGLDWRPRPSRYPPPNLSTRPISERTFHRPSFITPWRHRLICT